MRKLERFQNYLQEKMNNRATVSLYPKSILRGSSLKAGIDIVDYDVNYSHSLTKVEDSAFESEVIDPFLSSTDFLTLFEAVEEVAEVEYDVVEKCDEEKKGILAIEKCVSLELDTLTLSTEEINKLDVELAVTDELVDISVLDDVIETGSLFYYGDYVKYNHEVWSALSFHGMSAFIRYDEFDTVLEQYLDICQRLTKEVVYLRILSYVNMKDKMGGYLVYYNGITCYLPMRALRHLSCSFIYEGQNVSPTYLHMLQVHDLSAMVSPCIRVEAGEITLGIGHVASNFISSEDQRRVSPSVLTFVFLPL